VTLRFTAVSLAKKAVKLALLPAATAGREQAPGLFVLIYHRVGANMGREMDLPTGTFARHMRYVKERFEVVPLEYGVERLGSGRPLSRDLVAVTFDDGYREVYTGAWPVLSRLGIPATLFLATGFLEGHVPSPVDPVRAGSGAPPLPLSWDQVAEMVASGLVTVGSHSHTHRDFDRLSRGEAEEEAVRSKDILEGRLGRPVHAFAYPRAIPGHEDVVRAHYRYAVGAEGTKNLPGRANPHRLSRTPVRASDGTFFFRRRLSGIRPLEDRLYDRLRRPAPR
jgi:hypothetical protein